MTMQQIRQGFQSFQQILDDVKCRRYMLVCDASFPFLPIKEAFITDVVFDQFTPNPLYEQVCSGVEMFLSNQCDTIVAIGGGSTIDVAKCIKLFCRLDPSRNYLEQEYKDNGIPLIAIPTTAGTGSESTRYAVIYYQGKKQSITHTSIIPNYAILEPKLLATLPLYQKKCTLMDALCQGIESWWSVNSTDESKQYSQKAIEMILQHWHDYIVNNTPDAADAIMTAANYAGRAINITQTTAPHAMSYKLTSLYGLPHGHAVAVCLPDVWQYMLENMDCCVDERGPEYLNRIFLDIAQMFNVPQPPQAIRQFRTMLQQMELAHPHPKENRLQELDILCTSVNPTRLKNNPVQLSEKAIRNLYDKILAQ